MSASNIRRLFDLPLGSRFRYVGHPNSTYVLLSYAESGLVADAPLNSTRRPLQGMYSAAESRTEFEALMVELVPVAEAAQHDELLNLAAEFEAFAEAAMNDAIEEGDELSRITWEQRMLNAQRVIGKAKPSEGTASAQRINREVPVVQWERKKPDDSEGGLA
jgi:hypothetical protein